MKLYKTGAANVFRIRKDMGGKFDRLNCGVQSLLSNPQSLILPFTIKKAPRQPNCPSALYETQWTRNHGCPSSKAIGPGFRDTKQLKLNGREMTSAVSGGFPFSACSETSLTATPPDVEPV